VAVVLVAVVLEGRSNAKTSIINPEDPKVSLTDRCLTHQPTVILVDLGKEKI